MKICIVTHTFSLTDGQGRVNYKLAECLARAGHQVTLVSTGAEEGLVWRPNIVWRPVPIPPRLPTALLRHQWFALGARRAIAAERGGFDIVHLNGSITYFGGDVNASHFVHADWLKSPHHTARVTGGGYALYQWCVTAANVVWERRAYRAARRVVAVSERVRDSLIAEAGVPPAKVEVIFNGVDPEEFRPRRAGEPNALRQELGAPDNAFLSFFAGDLRTSRKNLDLILRALQVLGPRFHLAVAGDVTGSPFPVRCEKLGITRRVHYLGRREDVPALLRGADALPFATHYDPFGLVILEAMSCAVPVITAPAAGASALIRHGENGFVLRHSDDLEGLIAALRRLADDGPLAARVGAAARATAVSLGWDVMAGHYESLYERVLAEKRRAPEWGQPRVLPPLSPEGPG